VFNNTDNILQLHVTDNPKDAYDSFLWNNKSTYLLLKDAIEKIKIFLKDDLLKD
jgi:hypothetical protein